MWLTRVLERTSGPPAQGALDALRGLVTLVVAAYAAVLLATLVVTDPPTTASEALGLAAISAAALSALAGLRWRRAPAQDLGEAGTLVAASVLLDAPASVEFLLLLAAGNATAQRRFAGRLAVALVFGAGLAASWALAVGAVEPALAWRLPRLLVVVGLFGFVADVARDADRRVAEEQLVGGAHATMSAGLDADGIAGALAAVTRDAVVELDGWPAEEVSAATLLSSGGQLHVSAATGPPLDGLDAPTVGRVNDLPASSHGGDGRSGLEGVDAHVSRGAWAGTWPLTVAGETLGAVVVVAPGEPRALDSPALEMLRVEAALALDARRQEAERRRRERLLGTVLAESNDMVLVLDESLQARYASPAVAQLGWEPTQLEGHELTRLVHPDDRDDVAAALGRVAGGEEPRRTFEARVRDTGGCWHVIETIATDHRDDAELRGILLNARTVTERRALEEQLAVQAQTDPLTGVLNRAQFEEQVHAAISSWRPWTPPPAVLYLDLDNFKQVNDAYGHWAGDELLVATANRLRTHTRGGDTVGRLGGDEFAVLLAQADSATVDRVAERVIAGLRDGAALPGLPPPEASMGVAVARRGWSASELVRAADAALYEVKRTGKGAWRRYDDDLPSPQAESELLTDLGLAIERGDIAVHYQPLVSFAGRRRVAVEALARWSHPERGPVPPAEFIPLAERSGLIVPLGREVLGRGLADLAHWRDADADVGLQVNLSGAQVRAPDLVDDVADALDDTRVPPTALTLEITETTLVEDVPRTRQTLESLRELGVRLSVDDFGAGYAGLGYLRDLPVDELKIDRSYIANLAHSRQGASLVRTVIDLARVLGLRTVAEGVEHEEQAAALAEMGCARGQGFLFGRPVPSANAGQNERAS